VIAATFTEDQLNEDTSVRMQPVLTLLYSLTRSFDDRMANAKGTANSEHRFVLIELDSNPIIRPLGCEFEWFVG